MPIFIAEVAGNHQQDLKRCFQYIDIAANIGCDAVKFQLFRIEQLFAPQILLNSQTHRKRKAWELPREFVPPIANRCQQKNIKFACTPFDLDSVDVLQAFVDVFKIASYELLYDKLLAACAKTGIHTILSTGMATVSEIHTAVDLMRSNGLNELSVLHCVSQYPTLPIDANLAAIGTLRKELGCKVGWSDHTGKPGIIQRAVHRWDAEIVEFHLDIDGKGEDCKAGHCWLPHTIANVIEQINIGLNADGTGEKLPTSGENNERLWRTDPSDGLRPFLQIRDDAIRQEP